MIIKNLSLKLHEKLFEKAFPDSKPVTSEKEYYGRVRFFGHDISKEMLSDFKKIGWVESENKGERLYNTKSKRLF